MGLSKAFDTLNHKIGESFSKYQRFITGVPQGSILGSLLFNVSINDLFLVIDKSTLRNYANDNTLYTSEKDSDTVISKLKENFSKICKWFFENIMVLKGTLMQI